MDTIIAETFSRAPRPKGHWGLSNLLDFMGDLFGFLSRYARDYGDTVYLGPHPALLLNHPDQIEEVLVSRIGRGRAWPTFRSAAARASALASPSR